MAPKRVKKHPKRSLKMTGRRGLSLFLSLVMMISLVQIGAFAAAPSAVEEQEKAQIIEEGGTVYYNQDGQQVENGKLGEDGVVVEMSKTVAATGVENEFEVTLQVKTNQSLKEIPASTPDAAVMLVMDVSNSMDDCVNCGKEESDSAHRGHSETAYYCSGESGQTYSRHWHWLGLLDGRYDCKYCHKTLREHNAVTTTEPGACAYRSRLEDAQAAAKDFLTQFATETGATGDDRRMVAIVSFGSNAVRELNWVDVRTQAGMDEAISAIDGLQVAQGGNSNNGGTNIEGGLMLAKNILNAGRRQGGAIEDVNYLYTILLTDGQPTYHVENDWYYTDATETIYGTQGGGDSTTYNDAAEVGDEADAILDMSSLSKLFSICFGDGVWNSRPFGWWSDANPATTNSMTIGEWLQAFSTNAYNGEADGLFDSFDSIADQIAVAAQAWRVTDTMGQDIIYEGELAVSDENDNRINNVVTLSEDGNSFVWNVLASNYDPSITDVQQDQDGNLIGTLGYTMKYKIRLNNTGFTSDSDRNTNSSAVLKYMVADENGEWPTSEDALKEAEFAVPVVKGYVADLDFTKIASDTEKALLGAQFQLEDTSDVISWSSQAASGSNGKVEFTNIPSGYTYTLTETSAPEGYNTVDPITVTVAYGKVTTNPEIEDGKLVDPAQQSYINVTITKTWQKPADQATPDSITVTLLQDGVEMDGYTNVPIYRENALDPATGEWTYTFKKLPKVNLDTGEEYTYTVKEAEMDGWTVTYSEDGRTITNTASGKTSYVASKFWILPEGMDASNMSVTVTLTQNGKKMEGSEYTKTITGNGMVKFEDLDKYDENGILYVYGADEAQDSSYQQAKPSTGDDYTITFYNTVAQEKLTVSGTKTWNDGGDVDSRPASIEVTLLANGEPTEHTAIVTAADDWTYSFTGLDRYEFTYDEQTDIIIGVSEIEYTVQEAPVDGYASVVNGADITNTRTGTIDLTVSKRWVAESVPDQEVTVELYANGVATGKTVTFEDFDTFEDLPQYDAQGVEIEYSVVETPVDGFTASYGDLSEVSDGVYEIIVTNTQNGFDPNEEVLITVTKTWQQPGNVEEQTADFYLCIDGERSDYSISITGNGTASFNPMPRYDEVFNEETGETEYVEISYSVEEDAPDNYTVSVEDPVGPDSNGNIYYHFVNTIQGTTSLSLEKTWVQPADVDTPVATFTIQRSVDGQNWEEVGPITLMDGKTSDTRDNLEKYDSNGQLYIYRVVENAIPGYSSVITGGMQEDGSFAFEAVNTINQATANITVSKTWIDGSTPNSQRPDVTLDLLQDGIVVGTVTFGWGTDLFGEERVIATMNGVPFGADVSEDGNTWSIQFADMPLYNDTRTHRYEYTVQELNVPGDYQVSVAGTTATNKLAGTIEIPITKYWADPDGTTDRPDITLRLTGTDGSERVMTISDDSGEPVVTSNGESLPITADGSTWTFYVKNLPEYTENGAKITYTLTEDPVAGYTSSSVDGQPFAIKNTIDQDSSYSISAAKVWANMDTDGHYDPKYPESITVALYRDGVKVEDSERTIQPDENGGWGTVTYSDLDKYNPTTGKAYVYAIYELDENGSRVENGGTISFGQDNDYTVTYETEGGSTTITNTFKEPAKYLWVVNAHYTHYDYNGNVIDSYNTLSEIFSETSSQLVSADPDDYAVSNGLTYVYDADNENNKTEVTLEQENYLYELHLYYELRDEAPTDPDEPDNPGGGGGRGDRTVTVYYREEGTRDQLADTEQREYDYGDAWDVTDLTDLAIDGYVITRVEGDTSGDRLTSNKTVTVWYSNDETDIEDPDTPTTDLPDGGDTGDTGGTGDTGNTGGGTDIGDEDVPLAEAPETGDASLLWVILAIASGSGLIWLALTGKKRKECEEQ